MYSTALLSIPEKTEENPTGLRIIGVPYPEGFNWHFLGACIIMSMCDTNHAYITG